VKVFFLTLGVLLSISGCHAEPAKTNSEITPKTHQVDIIKFKFVPADITLNKGDTIIWVNQEKRQYHSVWFEQLGDPEPDYFFPGEKFSRTFNDVGSFPYRCGPHPEMIGSVTVK